MSFFSRWFGKSDDELLEQWEEQDKAVQEGMYGLSGSLAQAGSVNEDDVAVTAEQIRELNRTEAKLRRRGYRKRYGHVDNSPDDDE